MSTAIGCLCGIARVNQGKLRLDENYEKEYREIPGGPACLTIDVRNNVDGSKEE